MNISVMKSTTGHRLNKIQETMALCVALAFRTIPCRMLRVFKCIGKHCIFIFIGHLGRAQEFAHIGVKKRVRGIKGA
jgi:hypothetical protein